ncbi:nucleoside phosphorylase [Clostridium oryzae]|uniref:Uridine phosphorylase n=1 Tax=Clostridium oryzae TaxID=1450648 RepID=A0A1V4IZF0_9CLOT|nr:nucleoside phosphorylase [Clostridium oryzae]OPJ65273.1 purine nucleoside phosphorylase DeoD-type [Clostridium oryzae]
MDQFNSKGSYLSKIERKEVPILEFDNTVPAVIEPSKETARIEIPEHAVVCFFSEVIDKLKNDGKVKLIINLKTEMGAHPLYEVEYLDKKMVVFHPGVGAPLAAALLEEVIALGCNKFIACGSAGVLNKEMAVGHIIVPDSAIRDEGTSYHYIKPGREVEASTEGVQAIKRVLEKHKCNYIIGKTWTTDAIYRETPEKVKLRKEEGCLSVEMEASAFFAVSEFRKVIFAQLLYGGDDVSCEEWNSRRDVSRKEIREKLFWYAAEACLGL